MLIERIEVKENLEINGVVLEKGFYSSTDFCFLGGGLNDLLTNNYKIDENGNIRLVIFEDKLINNKQIKERLSLKINGIIHIYQDDDSELEYKIIVKNGIIKKIYRADTNDDFEALPQRIKKNYITVWK